MILSIGDIINYNLTSCPAQEFLGVVIGVIKKYPPHIIYVIVLKDETLRTEIRLSPAALRIVKYLGYVEANIYQKVKRLTVEEMLTHSSAHVRRAALRRKR